jgi:hypothetical protein
VSNVSPDEYITINFSKSDAEIPEFVLYTKHIEGKFSANLYLYEGPGMYKIRINYGGLLFSIKNEDTEDHSYLFPTNFVESDDPEIIQLAYKITEGLTTDYSNEESDL